MIPPAGFKNQPTIDFDTRMDRWDIPKDQHLANGCTVGIGVTTLAFRITEHKLRQTNPKQHLLVFQGELYAHMVATRKCIYKLNIVSSKLLKRYLRHLSFTLRKLTGTTFKSHINLTVPVQVTRTKTWSQIACRMKSARCG